MRRLLVENAFKRDLTRLEKRGRHFSILYQYIECLRSHKELPPRARPHKLSGEYVGLWECHVENDWLLIYNLTADTLLLIRTGSHDDLFE